MNKAHILQEIKRTAKANGGVPLGINAFSKETGIKSWDWQKYWARWSEAVREAGFTPNLMTSAYDEAELLDKYAKLAQTLGILPTKGDLFVKAHSDPEFPSAETYNKRLGGKAELVRKLDEYCRSHNEYADVTRLCAEYVSPKQGSSENIPQKPAVSEDGCVYLIKSGHFHKIGRANSAGRREYELSIQLPEKAKTIHVIRTDDPSGVEAYWHNRFAAKRKNGEWFELSAADIAIFKRRKFM
jgi:hypothetical protein